MAEADGAGRGAREWSWRDPQRWRLASGLVLFAFVLTHFLNHALGLVSLGAMEAAQDWRYTFWRSTPGTALLYGAAAVHVVLALAKLVRRRTLRMPRWEAVQIVLGLAIPLLLASHIAATRGFAQLAGGDDGYVSVLRGLWPNSAVSQSALLVIVWVHAMIGLHHWLRRRAWYAAASPVLLTLSVLIPTLAIAGWIGAARQLPAVAAEAAAVELMARKAALMDTAQAAAFAGMGLLVALMLASRARQWLGRGALVTYPGGRKVRAPAGATLLEASRLAGVPHASVCGGRGRCSTCRVLVTDGLDRLPAPGPVEAAALRRLDAPPGVRLACQIRPEHPLTVRPLVPSARAVALAGEGARDWGVERRITVMFADLRGFTRLAERLYPYDAVFLLNRYFEVMTEAVERHGGEVDKFLGDGVMALFGVSPARGSGSRDALLAAKDMLAALDTLNVEFDATLRVRLRMGIGIHMGPAVLGRVGSARLASLTALGDSVNVASRLESLNKEFGSVLVVSDAALRAAHLRLEGAEPREIEVRGRNERLRVHVAREQVILVEDESASAQEGPVVAGQRPPKAEAEKAGLEAPR